MMSPKIYTPRRVLTGRVNSPRFVTPGRSKLQSKAKTPGRVRKLGNEAKVRVVVRVRPILEVEQASEVSACTEIFKGSDGEDILRISDKATSRMESYKLDACYADQVPVNQIFAAEVEPVLPSIFRGLNATVFAYGATGSGKTYTMQGAENEPGLMPLAMESILAMANMTNSKVKVSFYEVYMDRCYDLLDRKDTDLPVLEDFHGRVQLRGLAQVQVNNIEEYHAVFADGCALRRTGATGLNDVSSRSHSILTITVTGTEYEASLANTSGKLNLIDLAGSENNRRTGNDGVRLVESTAINQSLFALSNVIDALNANDSRVPYRDSKLTRILQDSLGGTSRAVMVACLNSGSYQESSATLSMASRSRQVVNRICLEHQDEEKMDMEAKLKAWREAKNRTPRKPVTIYPSPLCVKMPAVSKTLTLKRVLRTDPKSGKAKPSIVMMDKAGAITAEHECTWQSSSSGTSLEKTRVEKETGVSWTLASDPDTTTLDSEQGQHLDRGELEEEMKNFSTNTFTPAKLKSPPLSTRLKNLYSEGMMNNFSMKAFTPFNTLKSPPLSARLKNLCNDAKMENLSMKVFTPVQAYNSPPLSARLKNLSLNLRALTPLAVNVPRLTSPTCKPSRVDLMESNCHNFETLSPSQSCNDVYCDPLTLSVNDDSMCTPTPYISTPHDRFSRTNPKLQRTLVKEYLDVLNTASREDLLQLRGIGPMRAANILKLREDSPEPLKEFEDLQKIGLSLRQAHSIFNTNVVRQVVFPPE